MERLHDAEVCFQVVCGEGVDLRAIYIPCRCVPCSFVAGEASGHTTPPRPRNRPVDPRVFNFRDKRLFESLLYKERFAPVKRFVDAVAFSPSVRRINVDACARGPVHLTRKKFALKD